MAGFKTHLAAGGVTATLVMAYALKSGLVTAIQLPFIASLTVLGSLLPDLDSDTGRPVKILYTLTSTLVVLLTINLLFSRGAGLSTIVVSVALAYGVFLLFFVLCKKLTVHRGIMHSVPFSLLLATIAALYASITKQVPPLLAGFSMFVGVITHLVLDESNAFGLRYGFIPYVKKSFGSALKWSSDSTLVSLFVYVMASAFATACVIMH